MFEKYTDWKPSKASLPILDAATDLAMDLASDGITPTVRQLYYMLVRAGEGVIDNSKGSERLVRNLLLNARMAGRFDWDLLQDRELEPANRTPNLGAHLLHQGLAMELDLWRGEAYRPEVWTEKESLVPFVKAALRGYQVPVRTLGGSWVGSGFLRQAAQEHIWTQRTGQEVAIIYLGDHDALGLHLEEDLQDRLRLMGSEASVIRWAADWVECTTSGVPPMPEPETNQLYRDAFGDRAFEPEAYDPRTLAHQLREEVGHMADRAFSEASAFQSRERARLLEEDYLRDTTAVPTGDVTKLVGLARETADTTRARALKSAVLDTLGDLA